MARTSPGRRSKPDSTRGPVSAGIVLFELCFGTTGRRSGRRVSFAVRGVCPADLAETFSPKALGHRLELAPGRTTRVTRCSALGEAS